MGVMILNLQNTASLGNKVIEELHCNLLSLNQPSALLDILVPLKEKVKHDHTYSLLLK